MALPKPRLVVAQRPTRRDHLHGAWWPRTTHLDEELLPMLSVLAARFPVVLGVALNRDEWPGSTAAGQSMRMGTPKLSWYGLSESHLVLLHCAQGRRIALLLIPPDTPERIALTATLMTTVPGNALTAEETLSKALADAPAVPLG